MSFQATVINVMIASPSDVPRERQVVRDAIYTWNAIHADERKQVLLPIGWETHSTPDMSGPPQSIINEQILFNCDLLIGIFWTRIGTPTTEYASGAVEEIERHIEAGKPTMLYFSNKPVKPEKLDRNQYDELIKFKKSCQIRGLYSDFKNITDFRKKFEINLAIKINKNFFLFKKNIEDELILLDKRPFINLSKDEKKLLKYASIDKHGMIHRYVVSGGRTYIETGNIHIIENQSIREIARWDAVLNSLVRNEYIEVVGDKKGAFKITDAGFRVVDNIEDISVE